MTIANTVVNRLRRAESWESFLARPPWRPVKVISAACVMLVAVWMSTALAGHLFALAALKSLGVRLRVRGDRQRARSEPGGQACRPNP
jgi:hypothetical protein